MISGGKSRFIWAAVLLLIATPIIAAAAAETADVSGTWKVMWTAQEGPQSATFTFSQEGEKLSGTYTDPGEHTSPVTGEVKGHAIEFAVDVESDEGTFTLTFRGTVRGDSMEGTMTAGGEDVFEWSGTKTD